MKNSRLFLALIVTALLTCVPPGPQVWAQGASPSDPTTWWPDSSSGLMWAGTVHTNANGNSSVGFGFPWQIADTYCANLNVGGFSHWRLPALDEVKTATEMRETQIWMSYAGRYYPERYVYNGLFFKGRGDLNFHVFWTSSNENGAYWFIFLNADAPPFDKASPDSSAPGVLCVRPMDPDMAALAKDTHVDVAISTMQEFNAYVSLSKARISFQAGQYNDSLQQAQTALQLKPDFLAAIIGVALSRGALGQWDQAVSILQSARSKLDWNNSEIKGALKWAKDGQKAAAKGKQPKGKIPEWN